MDPAFASGAPRMTLDENGKERLSVEGKLLGNPRGIGSLGAVGVRQGAVKLDSLRYAEGRKGGFDPHARITDHGSRRDDAAFLYPSLGLFAGAVADPGLAAALCRAYNRWLADYCKPYPTGCLGSRCCRCSRSSSRSRRCATLAKALGMRGGFLRPNPYHGNKMISAPMLRAVRTMAEELDFSIGFTRARLPDAHGRRRPLRRPCGAPHDLAHDGDDAGGDELDLGRRRRIVTSGCASAFLESGGGDCALARPHGPHLTIWGSMIPPEDAARASCSGATAGSRSSRSREASPCSPTNIGPHKIMWATDYPHQDGFFSRRARR